MEVGFVFYFEATSHGVWLRSFMSGLRIIYLVSRPLRMFCNNLAAVLWLKIISGSKSKHIDIKYLVIKERIKGKKKGHKAR